MNENKLDLIIELVKETRSDVKDLVSRVTALEIRNAKQDGEYRGRRKTDGSVWLAFVELLSIVPTYIHYIVSGVILTVTVVLALWRAR